MRMFKPRAILLPWLGLALRQFSTSGHISKQGDRTLRSLVTIDATACPAQLDRTANGDRTQTVENATGSDRHALQFWEFGNGVEDRLAFALRFCEGRGGCRLASVKPFFEER
jgi:hypothetical protein